MSLYQPQEQCVHYDNVCLTRTQKVWLPSVRSVCCLVRESEFSDTKAFDPPMGKKRKAITMTYRW